MGCLDLSYVQSNLVNDEKVIYQPKESKLRLTFAIFFLLVFGIGGFYRKDVNYFEYFGLISKIQNVDKPLVIDDTTSIKVRHKNISSKTKVAENSGSVENTSSGIVLSGVTSQKEDFFLRLDIYMPIVCYLLALISILPILSYFNMEMAFIPKPIWFSDFYKLNLAYIS